MKTYTPRLESSSHLPTSDRLEFFARLHVALQALRDITENASSSWMNWGGQLGLHHDECNASKKMDAKTIVVRGRGWPHPFKNINAERRKGGHFVRF